jgi:hypothetical protein
MKIDIVAIRKATEKALGKDADLSYITEELLTKASEANLTLKKA